MTNSNGVATEVNDLNAKNVQIERLRRMLSAVNHDLRQPLQTMELLCGVLTAKTRDQEILKVNARLEETLRAAINVLDSIVSHERLSAVPDDMPCDTPPAAEKIISFGQIKQPCEPDILRAPTIYIVDDDREVREAMGDLLSSNGYDVEQYSSCEKFLAVRQPNRAGCLLIDALFPGMGGLDLLKRLKAQKDPISSIMITGRGDVSLAVEAMKIGAVDFIEKPIEHKELLKIISGVVDKAQLIYNSSEDRENAIARLSRLSQRERQIMNKVIEGQLNKNIAADLGISQRTVETHRANIMKKMEVKSLPALLKLTMAAA